MLRTAFVLDYQNVHLTARDVFDPGGDAHESLIQPVNFAKRALVERNSRQRPDMPHAQLSRVLCTAACTTSIITGSRTADA